MHQGDAFSALQLFEQSLSGPHDTETARMHVGLLKRALQEAGK